MILYRPDGSPLETSLDYKPRCCFLVTRLGTPIDEEASRIRAVIVRVCRKKNYKVIDATEEVTGRDFFNKIWELMASTPLSVGILHHSFPLSTTMNICYELGMARNMGKETIVIKSNSAEYPSDLIRDEYIEYDRRFATNFSKFLDKLDKIAEYYEKMADQLEKDPLLSIDYLKRAYLITSDKRYITKIEDLVKQANFGDRAKNSVENLASKLL